MLNMRLAQPAFLVDIRRIPELTRDERARRLRLLRQLHHACCDRGRQSSGRDAGPHARGRRAHRLPRRAQPRHDRRQRLPCRSGCRLGERADAAWRHCRDRRSQRPARGADGRVHRRRLRDGARRQRAPGRPRDPEAVRSARAGATTSSAASPASSRKRSAVSSTIPSAASAARSSAPRTGLRT